MTVLLGQVDDAAIGAGPELGLAAGAHALGHDQDGGARVLPVHLLEHGIGPVEHIGAAKLGFLRVVLDHWRQLVGVADVQHAPVLLQRREVLLGDHRGLVDDQQLEVGLDRLGTLIGEVAVFALVALQLPAPQERRKRAHAHPPAARQPLLERFDRLAGGCEHHDLLRHQAEFGDDHAEHGRLAAARRAGDGQRPAFATHSPTGAIPVHHMIDRIPLVIRERGARERLGRGRSRGARATREPRQLERGLVDARRQRGCRALGGGLANLRRSGRGRTGRRRSATQSLQHVVADARDFGVLLCGAEVLHQPRGGIQELLDAVRLQEFVTAAIGLAAVRELVAILPHDLGVELVEAVLGGDRTQELADRHRVARALANAFGIALVEVLVVADRGREQRLLRVGFQPAPPRFEPRAEVLQHASHERADFFLGRDGRERHGGSSPVSEAAGPGGNPVPVRAQIRTKRPGKLA